MEKFLRRMNRGIALAVVLVVGLIAYLTVDNIRFSGERNNIKTQAEALVKTAGGMNVFPEEYNQVGKEIPKNIVDVKVKDNKEILKKYYTALGISKEQMEMTLKSFEDNLRSRDNKTGIVFSESYKLIGIKSIRKISTGLAKTTLEYEYTVEIAGNPQISNISGNVFFNGDMSNPGMYGKGNIQNGNPTSGEEKVDMNQHHKYTVRYEAPAEFIKKGGTWKIYYIYSQSERPIATSVEEVK